MGEKGVRVTDWECPEGRRGDEGEETFSTENGGLTAGWSTLGTFYNPCLEFGHASGEVCVHPHMHVPTGWNGDPEGGTAADQTAPSYRSTEAVQHIWLGGWTMTEGFVDPPDGRWKSYYDKGHKRPSSRRNARTFSARDASTSSLKILRFRTLAETLAG